MRTVDNYIFRICFELTQTTPTKTFCMTNIGRHYLFILYIGTPARIKHNSIIIIIYNTRIKLQLTRMSL